MEAVFLRGEDVYRDECVVGEEAGFEDRRGTLVDQLARERDALRESVVWQIDEYATREAVARERTDLRALVEAVLEHFVGLELDGEGLVDFPPQELVALDAGRVARLGKTVRHGLRMWEHGVTCNSLVVSWEAIPARRVS